jgi:hypothetical protein
MSQNQKKTQELLDRYVSARRSQAAPPPVKTLRWGRLLAVVVLVAGVVAAGVAIVVR